MKKLKSLYSTLSTNEARAFWACVLISVMVAFTFVASTLPSIGNAPTLGNWIGKFIPVVIGLATLASAALILRGSFNLAGIIFISGFGLSLLATPMVVEGLGFISAAVVFIICSYFAGLVMKGRGAQIAQYGSALVSVLIMLLEMYWPGERPEILPRDFTATLIAGGAIVLLYAYYLIRQFYAFRLRSKLLIISLILAIVPMATIGWMAAQVSENALTKNANDALVNSASQIAGALDAFVTYTLDTLRTESRMDQVVRYLEMDPAEREDGANADMNLLLSAFRHKSSLMITSYGLIDRFGIMVANTFVDDMYLDRSHEIYFREVMRTGLPYVSPVMYPQSGSRASIYFAAPVRNDAGNVLGVLVARFNADVLQQQMIHQSSEQGQMGTFFILAGENNTLLAHTSNPNLMYKSVASLAPEKYRELQNSGYMPFDQPMEKMVFPIPDVATGITQAAAGMPTISGEFFNREVDAGGEEEYAAVSAMQTTPWHVLAIQEADLLYTPIDNMVRGVVLMGVIAGVISLILAALLAQLLSNPLIRLAGVAERVAQGDFTARAPVEHTGDEVSILAQTFNTMAAQLSNLINTLEQRVTDRTKALVTSAEVSRRISTILDRDQLIGDVVEQLQMAFNYYHVHIYLTATDSQNLILAGGTGEAGKLMMARGHFISKGKGLVGRAAETGVPVLVPDVSQAEGWLPNPLLPETKSELAVPITLGESMVGVIDVQQNVVNGLQESDADLLQSIAGQVAIALQNARSYADTQRRANRESMLSMISQRIQRTNTAEEALQVAVRELARALDAPQATVRLNMKSNNGHNHS